MRLAVRLLPLAVIAVGGCAHRGNVDLLEARLRDQEDQLRSLHAQVDRTNSELTAARRVNESLKQKVVQPASHDEQFEFSEQQFQVTGLKINSLLTGGFNRDGQPGDDQVTLVFAPVDRREQPVQLPGRVECELLDLAQPADARNAPTAIAMTGSFASNRANAKCSTCRWTRSPARRPVVDSISRPLDG